MMEYIPVTLLAYSVQTVKLLKADFFTDFFRHMFRKTNWLKKNISEKSLWCTNVLIKSWKLDLSQETL